MKQQFRCDCPMTSAVDILGDKWTLVILKQMLLEGKETFKDFTESDEAIATNILSSRLKDLEEYRLVTKGKLPDNQKTNIYRLTENAIALTPMIVEMVLWSDTVVRPMNPNMRNEPILEMMHTDKAGAIEYIKQLYRDKISG